MGKAVGRSDEIEQRFSPLALEETGFVFGCIIYFHVASLSLFSLLWLSLTFRSFQGFLAFNLLTLRPLIGTPEEITSTQGLVRPEEGRCLMLEGRSLRGTSAQFQWFMEVTSASRTALISSRTH